VYAPANTCTHTHTHVSPPPPPQGARDNAHSLQLEHKVELLKGNARVLKEIVGAVLVVVVVLLLLLLLLLLIPFCSHSPPAGSSTCDVIVTNPPWGVRVGKCEDIDELYRWGLQLQGHA